MSPRAIAEIIRTTVPVLHDDQSVGSALDPLLDSRLPALPVIDDADRYAGIFGEREFITALFPGYVSSLKYAAFVPKSVDAALAKRAGCRDEPVSRHMNTEHIDVPTDVSDVGLAEIFIHHRVLIIPMTDHGRVIGVITRADFFAALASRFLAAA